MSKNTDNEDNGFMNKLNQTLNEYSTPQKIEDLRDSCIFNIVSHGAIGFVFGGFISLFLAGLGSTGPESAMLSQEISKKPILQQVKLTFKDMGRKTWGGAKNFGWIAALFTGFECSIESYRAKHDIANTLFAGCMTGGVLGAKSGPKSAALGCAGFAAFSAAIEHFIEKD